MDLVKIASRNRIFSLLGIVENLLKFISIKEFKITNFSLGQ